MNDKDRVLARFADQPTDRRPFMSITIKFAAGEFELKHCQYARTHR